MARGFESKAVADQQDSADAPVAERASPTGDPLRLARLKRLELERVDVLHRLTTAQAQGHREILERALRAVEAEIGSLPPSARV